MTRAWTSLDLNMDAQELPSFVHLLACEAVIARVDGEVAFLGSFFFGGDGLFSILFRGRFFVGCLLLVLASLLLLF